MYKLNWLFACTSLTIVTYWVGHNTIIITCEMLAEQIISVLENSPKPVTPKDIVQVIYKARPYTLDYNAS